MKATSEFLPTSFTPAVIN
jgi:hypothetical protein